MEVWESRGKVVGRPASFFDRPVAKSFRRATANCVETSPAISDSIHVEQLEISARVGVTDAERNQPQRLTVSLTMWPHRPLIDLGDDIWNTINYSAVCNETKDFLRDCSCKLIETLADRLAMHLLKQFPIQKITVELRKFVLPDTKFVAVTITRSAVVR
jgi:dihydroneopterin aldolase